MLTADEAHALLTYDPETGVFRWRVDRPQRIKAGDIAGSMLRGRRRIKIGGVSYAAARLAVLMMTGRWPTKEVDHRDRVKSNDRWGNLREATHSQNGANVPVRRHSMVGLKGVAARSSGRFQAHIRKDGARITLGTFDTVEAAHAAYVEAAQRLHGEFAATA